MTFEARPATPDDAAEVAALTFAFYEAHLPGLTTLESVADIHRWLGRFDLEHDTRLLHEPATGRLAAVGTLETADRILGLDVWIDPALAGRGLAGSLAAWGEREAERRGLAAVRAGHLAVDPAGRRLLAERGYAYERSVYVMRIDLEAPPPAPAWPDGVTVSTLAPGGEGEFHTVVEEAFAGAWSHVALPLEEWRGSAHGQAPDSALWFLAREGGEPAAAAICSELGGTGWVWLLAVRPAWRRRGLGRALLLHAFGAQYALGRTTNRLAVDAGNESGAVRLYESVGMRIASQRDFWLRPVGR